jgi:hypothetical protein
VIKIRNCFIIREGLFLIKYNFLWNVNGLNTMIVTAKCTNTIIIILYIYVYIQWPPTCFDHFVCVTEWPPTCFDHFYVWQNDLLHVSTIILCVLIVFGTSEI